MWRPMLIVVTFAAIGFGADALLSREYDSRTLTVLAQLPRVQQAAFKSCRTQFTGRKLIMPNEHATVVRKWVPYDICVCQSKFMADTFKPDEFREHSKVVGAMYGDVVPHTLPREVLKDAAGDGTAAFAALAKSLATCVADFQHEQEAKTEAIKQQLAQKRLAATP